MLLLSLVLVGVGIFFAGYGVGVGDETFNTAWYSPLDGNGAKSEAVGNVQGGPLDEAGNTPLLLTVRGLRALEEGESYVLYVIRSKGVPLRCGTFAVGSGTSQAKLNYPGLGVEPRGWLVAREDRNTRGIGKILLRSR